MYLWALGTKMTTREYITDNDTDQLFNLVINRKKIDPAMLSAFERSEREFVKNLDQESERKPVDKKAYLKFSETPKMILPDTEDFDKYDFDLNSVRSPNKPKTFFESKGEKVEGYRFKEAPKTPAVKKFGTEKPATQKDPQQGGGLHFTPSAPPPVLNPSAPLFAPPAPRAYLSMERQQKARYLELYCRLQDLGDRMGTDLHSEFKSAQDIEAMEFTYETEVHRFNKKKSLQTARNALSWSTFGIEEASKRVPILKLNLNNWSNSIEQNMDNYDDVLEELAEKYMGPGGFISKLPPEIRLAGHLAFSAAVHHVRYDPTSAVNELRGNRDYGSEILSDFGILNPKNSTGNSGVNTEDQVLETIRRAKEKKRQAQEQIHEGMMAAENSRRLAEENRKLHEKLETATASESRRVTVISPKEKPSALPMKTDDEYSIDITSDGESLLETPSMVSVTTAGGTKRKKARKEINL